VTPDGFLQVSVDLARCKIAEDFRLGEVMKRIVMFMLLVVLSVAVSMPAQARTKKIPDYYGSQSKAAKQQRKMLKKEAKQQRKQMKLYLKEQQKEQKANRRSI
jgi:hypothetical protein